MVRVTVPATSANMGSGYDSIGIALELYNVIDMEESERIDISDKNGQFVPKDARNLIYQCAKRVYDECGKPLSGLKIIEDCAIPQTRGLGSSSACTVAGIMGANALLGEPLDRQAVIDLAATIEGHPDNSTPAILGGFCVALLENGHVHHVRVPVHGAIDFIVFIPDFKLSTEKARAALPKTIAHHDAVYNLARWAHSFRAPARPSLRWYIRGTATICCVRRRSVRKNIRIGRPYSCAATRSVRP